MDQVMALHPLRRLATPEEIAATAVWLCSDGAAYVNGAAIAADGGFTSQ
jgi:NAD(P)-dependent dehydrogenase (short-subunit alcohol dehydrogenase family)